MNSLARFSHAPQLYLPNRYGLLDIPPIIADPINDEFEGNLAQVELKWTVTSLGLTRYNVNSEKSSYIWGIFPAATAGTAKQLWLKQSTSVGTGEFSLTAKFSTSGYEAYQGIGIRVTDSAEANMVASTLSHTVDRSTYIQIGHYTSAKWTYTTNIYTFNRRNTVYLHLQRNASNVWRNWVNFSGGKNTWVEGNTTTKSITVEKIIIYLSLGTTAGQDAFSGTQGGIDWVRKDFIRL